MKAAATCCIMIGLAIQLTVDRADIPPQAMKCFISVQASPDSPPGPPDEVPCDNIPAGNDGRLVIKAITPENGLDQIQKAILNLQRASGHR